MVKNLWKNFTFFVGRVSAGLCFPYQWPFTSVPDGNVGEAAPCWWR